MSADAREPKLLPCPFCGKPAWYQLRPYTKREDVSCDTMGCPLSPVFMTPEKWNRRAPATTSVASDANVSALVKAARDYIREPVRFSLLKKLEEAAAAFPEEQSNGNR